jgi:hypothetical protein
MAAPTDLRHDLPLDEPGVARHLAVAYAHKAVDAIRAYEADKRRWAEIRASYVLRHPGDPVTAATKAAGDPRSAEATALAVWHRDEASVCASVASMLSDLTDRGLL